MANSPECDQPTLQQTEDGPTGVIYDHVPYRHRRIPYGAIEPSISGPTVPNTATKQETPSLKVVDNVSGKVRLDITADRVKWPVKPRQLRALDVFRFLGIPSEEYPLFDLLHEEQQQEPVQDVHFGKTYTIVKRICIRCIECNMCCTRSDAHILCSHGSFTHLWCRPQHVSSRCMVIVEGYINGIDLSTRFSDNGITKELSSIAGQYDITIPDDFNRT